MLLLLPLTIPALEELENISRADSFMESVTLISFAILSISSEARSILLLARFPDLVFSCHFSMVFDVRVCSGWNSDVLEDLSSGLYFIH
ncbi:uncharacterized protein METZ01_LOCUS3557 [marine metagenome]|uniref:Uncharacterized protein n=1 Tax=marine metagenome TaxID=408172 RepID=A0A381NAY1_9ZZZZ